MFNTQLNRMFTPKPVKHWRCTGCSYVFNVKKCECPYCKGAVVEVEGACGMKDGQK